VDRIVAAAAADSLSNNVRPRPYSLHAPLSPLQQTTTFNSHAPAEHTKAELPVFGIDCDSSNEKRSTQHVIKRHSFTSPDQSTTDSDHYVQRYPMTGNYFVKASPPPDTRQCHQTQFSVIDNDALTLHQRPPYRSEHSVFSPTLRRRLQKPPPSHLEGLSLPVSVSESPNHGFVTLERVQGTQSPVQSKTLGGGDSIGPAVLLVDQARQADFIRSRSTAALVENDVQHRTDNGRINGGFARRRQRPKWSEGEYTDRSFYAELESTAQMTGLRTVDTNEYRGGINCNSSEAHFPVSCTRESMTADLFAVSLNGPGSFERSLTRAESDSRLNINFDKSKPPAGTGVATRHRAVEMNDSREKSTGPHGSSNGDVTRRLVSIDAVRRGQENSVAVLSVRVKGAKFDFSDDQFQNFERTHSNCDTCSTRNDISTYSVVSPARRRSNAVAVSSCPQLALRCPSSGDVFDETNDDEHDAVIRGLRRLLEQRDDELQMLRSTMESNEMAMLNVIDDSRRAREAELARCRAEYERRLRSEFEAARKAERALQAEIGELETMNAALRRSTSEANPSASCSSVFPEISDVDVLARKGFPDFRPLSGSLDAVNRDRKRTAYVNGVNVSTAVPLFEVDASDRHRSAPDFQPSEHGARRRNDGCPVNQNFQSPSSEIENLQRCLQLANGKLDLVRKEFADEREQWLTEKERVIAYQLQLQLNYVQTAKRNAALETELRQLREELVQLAATVGLRRVNGGGRLQQQYLMISGSNAARSAGLNDGRLRVDAVQLDESTC